jgi:hypothetical protein
MKIRPAVVTSFLAVAALAGISAPAAASTPRSTGVQPRAAGPWKAVYLHAYSGNGCAGYDSVQRLAPIVSERCSTSSTWYERDLSRSSGAIQVGDKLEFVDSSMTYALGYSGGQIKLETPNADVTFVLVDEIGYINNNGPWQFLLVSQGDDTYFAPTPAPAGDPLVPGNGGFPPDAWEECPLDNAQCQTYIT